MNEKLLKSHFFDLELKKNPNPIYYYTFFDPLRHIKEYARDFYDSHKKINKWNHKNKGVLTLRAYIRGELFYLLQPKEFRNNESISHHKPRFD